MNAQIKPDKTPTIKKTYQTSVHDKYIRLVNQFANFRLRFYKAPPESQALFLKELEKEKAGEKTRFSARK